MLVVAAAGRWELAEASRLDRALARLRPERPGMEVRIDLGGVSALDSAGALVLLRLRDRLRAGDHPAEIVNAPPHLAMLLRAVADAAVTPAVERQTLPAPLRVVADVGAATLELGREVLRLVAFLGLIVAAAGRLLRHPRRLPVTPFVHHLQQTGVNALPIVGLLSFLIGIVLAFQGAVQLRQFGAELFVVDILAIGVLREIGVLLTAILVAGRSGSAFTAQIGTMMVNQEIDAMRTIGLDPVERLVLPRLLALVIALPLLTFFADIVALFGGAVMASVTLDIGYRAFIEQLRQAVGVDQFLVGMVKAPVFAFVIAMVGCFEGLRVSGSAESVGRLTTRAVVESIFLVIVLDAGFSVVFAMLDI